MLNASSCPPWRFRELLRILDEPSIRPEPLLQLVMPTSVGIAAPLLGKAPAPTFPLKEALQKACSGPISAAEERKFHQIPKVWCCVPFPKPRRPVTASLHGMED